jgi:hypothetical protein
MAGITILWQNIPGMEGYTQLSYSDDNNDNYMIKYLMNKVND